MGHLTTRQLHKLIRLKDQKDQGTGEASELRTTGQAADLAIVTDGSGGTKFVTLLGGGDLLSTNNLSDLTNFATARTNLGLAIGTDVQAHSSVLDNTTASFTSAFQVTLENLEFDINL